MSLYLSKSKYCSAVQCPKMLWLKKYRPETADESVMNETVLRAGNEVGDLAMRLFGEFREVPFGDLGEMIRLTEEWIREGIPVIAEASFSYDGLFCSVDILKNLGGRAVEMYEVKSSTGLHDIYYHDTAYQYHVLTGLGYDVQRVCLVHINSKYVRQGELDLEELFTVEDLTERVVAMQEELIARLADLETYMAQTGEPEKAIGMDCFSPYDCVFWRYCSRNLPHPNVFDLGGMQARSKVKLYEKGLVTYEDLLEKGKLKEAQLLQIRYELEDLPPKIDSEAIGDFLELLTYPLYFLDFETFQTAIPLFDEASPYEQIPFQYSLHIVRSKQAKPEHREYLAEPEGDPRRGVAESLCRDIPADVCIVAYNMTFEKGRIKRLAELYPDLRDHLMELHDHIVDIMIPFKQKAYYCKAMEGSYSIKYVLPALYPDDPELDYHNLEGVHNGSEASETFLRMRDMEPAERLICREELLKYCGLDTLAMVRVWEKLGRIMKEQLLKSKVSRHLPLSRLPLTVSISTTSSSGKAFEYFSKST